eukprot:5598963-Alexandrium_andersonii.AAC.1
MDNMPKPLPERLCASLASEDLGGELATTVRLASRCPRLAVGAASSSRAGTTDASAGVSFSAVFAGVAGAVSAGANAAAAASSVAFTASA